MRHRLKAFLRDRENAIIAPYCPINSRKKDWIVCREVRMVSWRRFVNPSFTALSGSNQDAE